MKIVECTCENCNELTYVFRELLGYAEKAAAEKDLKYLRLDTWAGNDTALKAFDNLGFIVEHSCSCTVKLCKPL